MASATLLLPPAARFGGQRVSPDTARWLGRADRIAAAPGSGAPGDGLTRYFEVLPRGWPAAAVTRQRDAAADANGLWMRADPVFVQPDINGARLMSHGDALALDRSDAEALLPALRPLFGDAGFVLDAPHPARWYLRVPDGAKLPVTVSPEQALGEDLFEHLPAGAEGRRWRSLLSEAQIVLHNHPHNARRAAAGLAPVNSLWFWGAGRLPDQIRTTLDAVLSDDDTLVAFGQAAGASASSLPAAWSAGDGDRLVDLRGSRDLRELDRDWLAPALSSLAAGQLRSVSLEFPDMGGLYVARGHRWRFWRRPLLSFITAPADGSAE